MRRRLFWRIYPPCLLVLLGVLAATVVVLHTSTALVSESKGSPILYGRTIAVAVVLAALGAALLAWFVSRRIRKPLEEFAEATDLFAHGGLDHRLRVRGSREIAAVAEGMNRMAVELGGRLRDVEDKRSEQEAVLASMVEAVVAADAHGRLITLNAAAAKLLGLEPGVALGRTIEETIRDSELQSFIKAALTARQPIQRELTFHGRDSQVWQAHSAGIETDAGGRFGVLVVLNDVTETRRLETIRSDFVANVSHELKTPITAVKGFLETLLDGALEDPRNARRFVEIACRQADRLNAIIEDLLSLSRLERDADSLERASVPLAAVLANAVEACDSKAREKRIVLESHCNSDVQATVNAPLFEQAVVNLIDNAVKYSAAGSSVRITGRSTADGHIEVDVRDHGPGIERRHLSRLFERFYRVDKARSRNLGGTGLGLAIVKHIAQAHGGSVGVTSEPGEGSTFRIRV